MKSIKFKELLRKQMSDKRINNLVKKALNDGIISKPSKGYIFLKDISLGSKFETNGIEGILLDINKSAARVVVTKVKFGDEDEKKYYAGKQIISLNTEVKKL